MMVVSAVALESATCYRIAFEQQRLKLARGKHQQETNQESRKSASATNDGVKERKGCVRFGFRGSLLTFGVVLESIHIAPCDMIWEQKLL
jgi:hypothetical protein